ncbi:MAG TPA: GNAT family N-acetyltransferase, partial [Micromonosporaceae bacterium]|nr:GNAT family N-acetyltransferase [Micromonosporaceae bacterium]
MNQPLPDGLLLRTAQPTDLDQISALLTDRGEAADAVDHRLIVEDPDAGWESCAVVVDGDRVVSTATLLDETLSLDGLEIPSGQVELVATDRGYEGRGLVRALMGWAHQRSAARGHVVQVMVGIPYFYRLFGYQYAIGMPHTRQVIAAPPAQDGYVVRPAGPSDIATMESLQDAEQSRYDLRMAHSAACWRWLCARDGSSQLLVERGGIPVATARITPPEEDILIGEVAAAEPEAALALVTYAQSLYGDRELAVKERPGSVAGDALDPFLAPRPPDAEAYYVRVADPVALLDHLRPVLSARLAPSGLGAREGEILLSFFGSHVRLPYRDGAVVGIHAGGAMQAPGSAGGAGIAPDLIGDL